MSFPADCPGCVMGSHEHHNPGWGCRPGLIGGQRCECAGDCRERFDADTEELRALLGGDPA